MAVDMRGKVSSEKIADNAVDGAIHIKSGSVATAKFALASVTTAVLADNAVTTTKTEEKVRTRPLAADDTEVNNGLATDKTVDTEVKLIRFAVKNAAGVTPDKIVVVVEIKTSLATSVATISLFIDNETTPRTSLSTALTTFDLTTASFAVGSGPGQLAEGVHTLRIKVKSALAGEVASVKLTEIYQVIL